MPRPKSRAFYWPMLVAPAMTVGLIALVIFTRPAQDRMLIGYWRDQLATRSDDEVAGAVDQLRAVGNASIPVLTELLGSERASVAEAARRTLMDEVDRWMRLPADEEAAKLALLAEALARHVGDFGPAARSLAARLTQQILMRPIDRTSIDRVALLADCDAVLLRVSAEQRQPEEQWPERLFDPLDESLSKTNAGRAVASGVSSIESDLTQTAQVPGGGLSVDAAQVPKHPSSGILNPQRTARANGQPNLLPTPPAQKLPIRPNEQLRLNDQRGSRTKPSDARRIRSRVGSHVHDATHLQSAASAGTVPANALRAEYATEMKLPVSRQKPLVVMQMLHDTNQATAETAIRELKRRGLSQRELRLARDLTDPDPQVRGQLVDRLGTLSGVNARPWLLALCSDSDADVRLAALSSMATSKDYQLVNRAAELARQDDDPRITALAKRLEERNRRR